MSELQEIENALLRHPDPVVSVPELEDKIGRSDTHIRDKLEKLEYLERVERKDVGARATAWWHVDRVTPRQVPPDEHPDQSALEDVAASDEPVSGERSNAWTIREAVATVDLPGYGETIEDRENALAAVLRRLRDTGPGKAEDLREESHDHHETHYETPVSWWKNAASPAMSDLADEGVVELVDRHDGVWAWAGGSDE